MRALLSGFDNVPTASPICSTSYLLTLQRRAQSKPSGPSAQRTALHPTVSDAAPTLEILFFSNKFSHFSTTDSNSLSFWHETLQEKTSCSSTFTFTSLSVSACIQVLLPCFSLLYKGCSQPLCYFVCVCVSLDAKALTTQAVIQRAEETTSVSLGTSLQPSFMPLSLAQRLTPSTSLSLPTLLLTEPQQRIDIPLRGLNTSDEYANGVQSKGESLQRH